MKIQILQFMFVLLISFESMSVHSKSTFRKDGEDLPYNNSHDMIGIEYVLENVSFGYAKFTNSFYHESEMLFVNINNDGFGVKIFNVSGYDNVSVGAIATYKMDYDNIEIEFAVSPSSGKNSPGLFTITKKVKF